MKNRWRHRLRIVDQSLAHRALTTKPRTPQLTAARQMYNTADGSTPNVHTFTPKPDTGNKNTVIITFKTSLISQVYEPNPETFTAALDVKAAAQTCRRQESRREEDGSPDVKKIRVLT